MNDDDTLALTIKFDDDVDDTEWPEWAEGEVRADGRLAGFIAIGANDELVFVALADVSTYTPEGR